MLSKTTDRYDKMSNNENEKVADYYEGTVSAENAQNKNAFNSRSKSVIGKISSDLMQDNRSITKCI